MAQSRRQQLRPRLEDLDDLPQDDANSEENAVDAESGVRRRPDNLHQEDDDPVYAPAATPVHSHAPTISAAKSRSKVDVGARHAPYEGRLKGPKSSHDEKVRFNVDLGQHEDAIAETSKSDDRPLLGGAQGISSLIGTIQERSAPSSQNKAATTSAYEGQSRFAALRRLDRDAGLSGGAGKGPGHASRQRRVATKTAGPADTEVWLDEEGQPMSSFRKQRLLKQGLRPPSTRKADIPALATTERHSTTQEKEQGKESGGGDPSIRALLKSISNENEAQVASMNPQQVERDLQDVREALGDRFLDLLMANSKRKEDSNARIQNDDDAIASTAMTEAASEEAGEPTLDTPDRIRRRYFPNEPAKLPSALQWTEESKDDNHDPQIRFDFSGSAITGHTSSELETRLRGLHNHGDNQDKPGYSLDELLHLARSTTPGQRVIALQTLARLVTLYPEDPEDAPAGFEDQHAFISKLVARCNIRGKASTVASWYVGERQLNVRQAALQCVVACLTSCGSYFPASRLVERRTRAPEVPHSSDEDATKARFPHVDTQKFADELLPALLAAAMLPDLTRSDLECLLEIFSLLCQRSRKSCTDLVKQTHALPHLIDATIKKRAWPSKDATEAPLPGTLALLDVIVASSRHNANLLVERRFFQALPRLLGIPTASLPETVRPTSWLLSSGVMKIYTGLARYGLGADEYGRNFSIFAEIFGGMTSKNALLDPHNSVVLESFTSNLALLANWTVCATDPHATSSAHDITWSQVSEWGQSAIDVLIRITSKRSQHMSSSNFCAIAAEAVRLLDAWLQGAARHKDDRVQDVISSLEHSDIVSKTTSALCNELVYLHRDVTTLPNILDEIIVVCRLGRTLTSLTETLASSFNSPTPRDAVGRLFDSDWDLRDIAGKVQSSQAYRAETLDGVMRFIADLRSCLSTSMHFTADPRSHTLRLLGSLRRGDEALARDLIDRVLPLQGAPEAAHLTLAPFLHENIRVLGDIKPASLYPSVQSIKSSNTLFLVCERNDCSDGGDETDAPGEDTDPMTGNVLWRSRAAGLPLRRDWPFCALDDLLHSGNCAALNRPDALPRDWDANEAQIVQAALSLTLWLCKGGKDATNHLAELPSSAELHMGIIKCLLLEEEQANNTRATGLITGRDLFRRNDIAQLLRDIFRVARDRLDAPSAPRDDLEMVTLRQSGPTMTFYQIYTDLVSVYDAVSFGDELFGRALLLPLTMSYAADYRRCLWIEHAHILGTLVTRVCDAPAPVAAYLGQEPETDQGLVAAYVSALMSGSVQQSRNELVYTIAVGHLKRVLWSSLSSSSSSASTSSTSILGTLSRRIARIVFASTAQPTDDTTLEHIKLLRDDIMDASDEEQMDHKKRALASLLK